MGDRSADLQLEEDVVFQRREWLIQRAGWVALGTLVAAAALGVFGSGPLSSARAGSPNTRLWAEYERFVRAGAPTRVIVRGTMLERASGSGFELRLPREYFESFRVEHVSPEPQAIAIGRDEVSLQFGRGAIRGGQFTVIFDLEPVRTGRHAAAIHVTDAQSLAFTQFAYF
jgi:hypothetical protein